MKLTEYHEIADSIIRYWTTIKDCAENGAGPDAIIEEIELCTQDIKGLLSYLESQLNLEDDEDPQGKETQLADIGKKKYDVDNSTKEK